MTLGHHARRVLNGVFTLRRGRPASFTVSEDPDATMIGGVRRTMTLWYAGVLSTALIVFGVALYLGEKRVLIAPIHDDLVSRAETIGASWQADPHHPCPRGDLETLYWVCFSGSGTILRAGHEAIDTPHFVARSLALRAVHAGSAADTVNVEGDVGVVDRYALAVPARGTHGLLGVVEVGVRVQGELNALHILLILLFALGALVLLGSAAGGALLARRALVPVRLSVSRQRVFIADASHELRTPLALIRADAEQLTHERDRMTSQGGLLLDDIIAEIAYMSSLAGKLLTLTEIDSDNLHMEYDVVDLAEVASAAVRRSAAFAALSQVEVSGETAHGVLVIGDRILLEQATLVLMENAIKYNRPNGSVRVSVHSATDRALLEVRDTGNGVTREHLAHLGERFYRIERSRSREHGGTGLGLSIARGIMSLHGGTLTIDSSPSVGTTATLVVPSAHPKSPATQPFPEKSHRLFQGESK